SKSACLADGDPHTSTTASPHQRGLSQPATERWLWAGPRLFPSTPGENDMNGQNLTTGSEVTAHLVAHAIRIVPSYVVSPMVFAALGAAGRTGFCPAVGL